VIGASSVASAAQTPPVTGDDPGVTQEPAASPATATPLPQMSTGTLTVASEPRAAALVTVASEPVQDAVASPATATPFPHTVIVDVARTVQDAAGQAARTGGMSCVQQPEGLEIPSPHPSQDLRIGPRRLPDHERERHQVTTGEQIDTNPTTSFSIPARHSTSSASRERPV
jgi:hypothetical protein